MNLPRMLSLAALMLAGLSSAGADVKPNTTKDSILVYPGGEGPGKGKHIVLIAADDEYRSEESVVQLGRILSKHHGFKCTVLFGIDKKTGEINPEASNIPGLEALGSADLMILCLRFRQLPDEQMKHIVDYVQAGKPVFGMRTSTHAFGNGPKSKYADWNWTSVKWPGGFGRQVLGETWVNHHAHHRESTRGIIVPKMKDHPILRGIKDGAIWVPTHVYSVSPHLAGDSQPLVLGQVLEGSKQTDKPVAGKKNDPMMPIAWIKSYTPPKGKAARVFNTTMGAAQDLESEGFRRMLVNASFWCVGLEKKIAEKSKVDLVGEFKPKPSSFGGFKKGVKPSDLILK